MVTSSQVAVGEHRLDGVCVATAHTFVLMISAPKGFLGCGYFSLETANRVGDAVALVKGVKTLDSMLEARVVAASDRAQALGVATGMSGKDALLRMI